MALEELYRQVILDHYRNPRKNQPLSEFDDRAEGVNPLCGDEVTVEVKWEDDRIGDIGVVGRGCSISQSAASMMAGAVLGKSRTEVEELYHAFRDLMELDKPDEKEMVGSELEQLKVKTELLGELAALEGVKRYPVRIKCALLGWTTLEEAMNGEGSALSD